KIFKTRTMSSSQNQASLYVSENIVHNMKTITFIRSSMSAITGSAVGILGLTSYSGFIFYAIASLFSSFLIWSIKTKAKPNLYFFSFFLINIFGHFLLHLNLSKKR